MELLLAAVGIGIISAGGLVVYVIVVCGKEKRRFRKEINMTAKREWDRVSKEWDEAPEEKELKQVISHKKEQIVTEKKSNDNEPKIGIKLSNPGNTRDEQLKKDSSRVYEIKEVKHINLQQSSLGENNSMPQDDCISNENGIGRVKKIHIGGFLK